MMTNDNIQLVDKSKHSNLRVQNTVYTDATFSTNNVMVIPSEMNQLVFEYPLFITKANQSEAKQFIALLGIDAGQNLYVENGSWNSKYIPLDILRRPFCLVSKGLPADVESVIAIDTSSQLISTETGTPLFNTNGRPSSYLERIQDTFSYMITGQQQAKNILDAAQTFDLLDELTIDYKMNEQAHVLSGFYGISLKKIGLLSPQDLKTCVDCGLLKVAYLLDISRQNLHHILNRYEASNPILKLQ